MSQQCLCLFLLHCFCSLIYLILLLFPSKSSPWQWTAQAKGLLAQHSLLIWTPFCTAHSHFQCLYAVLINNVALIYGITSCFEILVSIDVLSLEKQNDHTQIQITPICVKIKTWSFWTALLALYSSLLKTCMFCAITGILLPSLSKDFRKDDFVFLSWNKPGVIKSQICKICSNTSFTVLIHV